MITNRKIISELEKLAHVNSGVLLPEAIVARAENPKSALHSWFTWDDGDAAHKWRLHQARNLIRVTVQMVDVKGDKKPMRVFVSLTPDRTDGGYRSTVAVMSNKTYRAQLLSDALEEMKAFQLKYQSLRELVEVLTAMKRAQSRLAA